MKRLLIAFLLCVCASSIYAQDVQNVIGPRIYRVTAYKSGNNGIVSVSNYAEVKVPQNIYVPNAFTPNGDGFNDTFGVKGEGIQDFHIVIFNRWGEVVFETTNPKEQWDGTFKGQPAQQGTYNYQLYSRGYYASTPKSGSVTLLR